MSPSRDLVMVRQSFSDRIEMHLPMTQVQLLALELDDASDEAASELRFDEATMFDTARKQLDQAAIAVSNALAALRGEKF